MRTTLFESHSEIFESIQYIPLEYSVASTLGDIDKVEVTNNRNYIVFDHNLKTIQHFDSNGRFLNYYGSIGHGKGEYIEPCDIAYNPYTDQVWVVDLYNSINIYNLDGKWVNRITTKDMISNIGFIDKDHYCVFANWSESKHRYIIYNIISSG